MKAKREKAKKQRERNKEKNKKSGKPKKSEGSGFDFKPPDPDANIDFNFTKRRFRAQGRQLREYYVLGDSTPRYVTCEYNQNDRRDFVNKIRSETAMLGRCDYFSLVKREAESYTYQTDKTYVCKLLFFINSIIYFINTYPTEAEPDINILNELINEMKGVIEKIKVNNDGSGITYILFRERDRRRERDRSREINRDRNINRDRSRAAGWRAARNI